MHKWIRTDDCICSLGYTCSRGASIFRGQFEVEGWEWQPGGHKWIWQLWACARQPCFQMIPGNQAASAPSGACFYCLCSGIFAWRWWHWRWDRCSANVSTCTHCIHLYTLQQAWAEQSEKRHNITKQNKTNAYSHEENTQAREDWQVTVMMGFGSALCFRLKSENKFPPVWKS